MASFSVIEHLDVIEDIGTRFIACAISGSVDSFAFEQAEEAFSNSIVVAVAAAAHAAFDTVPGEFISEVVTGVLSATIGVMD